MAEQMELNLDPMRVIAWFKDRFGLGDWTFAVDDSKREPTPSQGDVVAKVLFNEERRTATVWLPPAEGGPRDRLENLMHELVHMVHIDCGLTGSYNVREEWWLNHLAVVLADAYLRSEECPES